MRLKLSLRKILAVTATLATLFNSIGAPISALAQEATPTPTDSATPTPTDATTLSTSPTDTPTSTLDASPAEIATPTPDVTPVPTDSVTPTPTDQPTTTQAPESNPTTTSPPESPTVSASATPTATQSTPVEHGTLSETLLTGIDLSSVTGLNSNVTDSGTISTNQNDYSPTSLVLITGSGFIANKDYTINIVSTDQPPVDFTDQVKADSSGNITYSYQLDGNYRPNYTVYIKSGEVIVATTSFTDTSFGLAQCAQDDSKNGHPLGLGYCNWIGSALGTNNSLLYEGMATEQQLIVTGMTGTTHTMRVGLQATKGGSHAYDWLVSDATTSSGKPDSTLNSQQTSSNLGITLQLNRCSDSLSTTDKATCTALVGSSGFYVDIPVPDDSFISADGSTQTRINAYESLFGNRTVRLYSSAAITSPTMTLAHMDGKLSGNVLANGADTGDSYIWYTITWTSSGSNAMLTAGADIALGDNSARGWGTGRGAAGISGDPYHFYLINVDGTGGSLDNQMSANAVIPFSTITIHKVTSPTGGTGFGFTTTGGLSPSTFSLNDGGSTSYTSVVPGSYTVVENDPSGNGYSLTGLTCGTVTGTGTSATTTLGTRTLSITIGSAGGANVDCTYTNTFTKLSPSISTTLSATSVGIGVNVHDSATLTGATSNAGGTVTYHAYAGANTCTGTDLFGVSGNQKTVTGGEVPNSDNISFASAGTYSFQAVYSGDTNNNGATSVCSTEQVVVSKNSPTISTILNDSSIAVGSSTSDTATLSGTTSNAGGTVTYTAYSNNLCTLGAQSGGTKTVTSGVVPNSDPITFNTAGDYYWQAVYSGDSNNSGASSTCTDEHLVVNKASPSLSTDIHNANHDIITTIDAGSTVHDSATISGGFSPTGNVQFTFFPNNTCAKDTGASAGAVALSGGVAHPSNNEGPLNAGSYSFIGHYVGDTNNNPADSTCEPLTVNPLNPIIGTTPNPTGPVSIGTTLNDSAALSIGYSPSGTILFSLYGPDDSTCSGTAKYSQTVNVTNGNNTYNTSPGFQVIAAGVYRWVASYSGDSNNNSAISGCQDEQVTVDKNSPTVSTKLSGTSVDVGSQVHDSATLSGATTDAGGTATFTVYTDDACTLNPQDAGTVTVTGGVVPDSNAITFNTAGDYYWQVVYSGDSNNKGATSTCTDEHLVINKVTPELSTQIHNATHDVITSIDAGSTIHDSADISGGFNPSGNVEFTFFPNDTCTKDTGASAGVVAVSAGVAHPSNNEGPLNAGSYSFMAHYVGDTNNNPTDSACEPLTVNQLTPSVTTQIHLENETIVSGPVVLGSTVHDKATVSGAFTTPSGNVDFTFFPNDSCTVDTGSGAGTGISLVSGIAHPSNSEGPLAAGSYSFMAHYNGDTNYLAADSGCEPFTVDKAQLSIDTIVHNAGHGDITNGSVDAGSVVHDTASVSGTVKGFDFPTPTFTLTSNYTDSCANGSAVGNDGTDPQNGGFKSSDSTQLNAGEYAYMATVAGNDNYLGAGSDCEPFSVGAITPRFSTTPTASPSPVLGATISDRATITGFNPTGTILFTLYHSLTNSDPCSGDPVTLVNPEVNVSGNNTYQGPSYSPVLAGFWNWIASYSGDANNNKVTGNCGDEQIEIPKSTPTVTTEVKDSQGHIIGINGETLDFNVNDSATVTGVESVPPTGNVTFTFFDNNTCARDTGTGAGTIALDNNGVASPANETLTQAGKYSFQAHYNGDNNYNAATSDCEPFTLSTLQIDKNTLGGDATFNFTSADSPTNIDKDVQTTGGAGTSGLIPVLSGDYSLSETPLTGWTLASSNCGVEVSPDSFTIDAGKSATCTFNNEKDGTVTVTKYNDTDKDGIFNNDEQVLSDWTINLGKSSDDTGENGQVIFDNVVPGSYQLSEDLQPGWIQTNIQCFYGNERPGTLTEDGYFVNVGPGDNINCFIGNFQPRKSIEIVKSNDKSGGASAGDTVTYTLVVTNTGDVNIPNVDVTDILPGGFTYVNDSATVNGAPQNPNISGSVLSWDIGTVTTETPVTIVYKVKIDGSESNGTYTNYASCREVTTENPTALLVLAKPAVCETVHSDVPIGGVTFGGHLGQVLGISTELPATGSPTILLIISLGLIGTGLYLGRYNSKKGAKRHAKN